MATQNLGIGCGLEWTWDIECKSDWALHGLNGECLHTSRLGEYNTLQMTGQVQRTCA